MTVVNGYGEPKDRIRAMSGHLLYELAEFQRLAQLNLVQSSDERLRNIYLDSFVVHLRNLLDFFYFTGANEDCLSVRSFPPFDSVEGISTRPKKSEILELAKDKANCQVSHLHYDRLEFDTPEKKPWQVLKIAQEIEGLKNWFWSGVDPHYLDHSKWSQFMADRPSAFRSDRAVEFGPYTSSATTLTRSGTFVIIPRQFNLPDQEDDK